QALESRRERRRVGAGRTGLRLADVQVDREARRAFPVGSALGQQLQGVGRVGGIAGYHEVQVAVLVQVEEARPQTNGVELVQARALRHVLERARLALALVAEQPLPSE